MKKFLMFLVILLLVFPAASIASQNQDVVAKLDEIRFEYWKRFEQVDEDACVVKENGFPDAAELMLNNFYEKTAAALNYYEVFEEQNEKQVLSDGDLFMSLKMLIFALKTMQNGIDEIRKNINGKTGNSVELEPIEETEKGAKIEPIEEPEIADPIEEAGDVKPKLEVTKTKPQELQLVGFKILKLPSPVEVGGVLVEYILDTPFNPDLNNLNKDDFFPGYKAALRNNNLFSGTVHLPYPSVYFDKSYTEEDIMWGLTLVFDRLSDAGLPIPVIFPVGTESFKKYATYVRIRTKTKK